MEVNFLESILSTFGLDLNPDRLEAKKNQLSSLSILGQFQYGCTEQAKASCTYLFLKYVPRFLPLIPIIPLVIYQKFAHPNEFRQALAMLKTEQKEEGLDHQTAETEKEEFVSPLYSCFLIPILEEVLFRGLLQTGVSKIQEIAKNILPPSLTGIRVITSPITAIVLTQLSFGLAHLPESRAQAFVATIGQESILQYVTGGRIYAPIGAHIVHNSICKFTSELIRKIQYLILNFL
jgi:membrane protease YdiL (CAAX protease family)